MRSTSSSRASPSRKRSSSPTADEAVEPARRHRRERAGRGRRRDGGVHPPDPVRGRPRGDPPAEARPDARADDAGPDLRPAHRHRLRDAFERGWPRPIELEEHSHAAMAAAYAAGAAGLPCAILRGYLGADLPKVNPNIRSIECPFTGERLAAVPAVRPDVAIVHAQRADRHGNVLFEGIVGVQKEAVLAARRSIVTVEEVVDD